MLETQKSLNKTNLGGIGFSMQVRALDMTWRSEEYASSIGILQPLQKFYGNLTNDVVVYI